MKRRNKKRWRGAVEYMLKEQKVGWDEIWEVSSMQSVLRDTLPPNWHIRYSVEH